MMKPETELYIEMIEPFLEGGWNWHDISSSFKLERQSLSRCYNGSYIPGYGYLLYICMVTGRDRLWFDKRIDKIGLKRMVGSQIKERIADFSKNGRVMKPEFMEPRAMNNETKCFNMLYSIGKYANMSKVRCAQLTGHNRSTLSKSSTGLYPPKYNALRAYGKMFGLTDDQLLECFKRCELYKYAERLLDEMGKKCRSGEIKFHFYDDEVTFRDGVKG